MPSLFVVAPLVLLPMTSPSRADDTGEAYWRQALVASASARADTPADLADEFDRVARELGELPSCGVAPDLLDAVASLRDLAGRLARLVRIADAHRRQYNDPRRVRLEVLVRALVGAPFGVERRLARDGLRSDLDAAQGDWYDCQARLQASRAAVTSLSCPCRHAFAVAEAALRDEPAVVAAISQAEAFTSAGDFDQVADECAARLKANSEDAGAYYLRAAVHFARRRAADAVADCTEALRLDPSLAFALALRGRARSALGDLDAALADSCRARAFLPDCLFVFRTQVHVFGDQGKLQDALADAQRILDRSPSDAYAHAARGTALGALGRHEEAIADFTAALKQRPDLGWVYHNRGHCHAERGDEAEALSDLGQAIALEPNDAGHYGARAKLYLQYDRNAKALDDVNKALKIDSSILPLYLIRAKAYDRLRDPERALADFGEAIRRDPKNGLYRQSRAFFYARWDMADEALADCDEADRLGMKSAALAIIRAHARLLKGDLDGALRDAEAALRLDPAENSFVEIIRRKVAAERKRTSPDPLLPPLPASTEQPTRHSWEETPTTADKSSKKNHTDAYETGLALIRGTGQQLISQYAFTRDDLERQAKNLNFPRGIGGAQKVRVAVGDLPGRQNSRRTEGSPLRPPRL